MEIAREVRQSVLLEEKEKLKEKEKKKKKKKKRKKLNPIDFESIPWYSRNRFVIIW